MYLHMPSLALDKSEVGPPPGSPAGPAVQIGCHQSRSPQLCSRCHSPTTRSAQRAFQLSWTNFGKDGLLIQVILASHKDWTNKALCLSCNCCCCFSIVWQLVELLLKASNGPQLNLIVMPYWPLGEAVPFWAILVILSHSMPFLVLFWAILGPQWVPEWPQGGPTWHIFM